MYLYIHNDVCVCTKGAGNESCASRRFNQRLMMIGMSKQGKPRLDDTLQKVFKVETKCCHQHNLNSVLFTVIAVIKSIQFVVKIKYDAYI